MGILKWLFGSKFESKKDYYDFLLYQAANQELSPIEKAHNRSVDMRIAHRNETQSIRDEHNELMQKKWDEYCEKELQKDPNKAFSPISPLHDDRTEPYICAIRYIT